MATATEWLFAAPGRRLAVPVIAVEWLLFGAWLVHAGVGSL